jgi:hypothetical protein
LSLFPRLKQSRKADADSHKEVRLQLAVYGRRLERTVGDSAKCLQVHMGAGDVMEAPNYGGAAARFPVKNTCQTQ